MASILKVDEKCLWRTTTYRLKKIKTSENDIIDLMVMHDNLVRKKPAMVKIEAMHFATD